jgi:hypothetical protein
VASATIGATITIMAQSWRYDLAPLGPAETEVRLSDDWSGVPEEVRRQVQIPPFSPDHLDNSLARLADLATA